MTVFLDVLREHPKEVAGNTNRNRGGGVVSGKKWDHRRDARLCFRPDSELGCARVTVDFIVVPAWLLLLQTLTDTQLDNMENWKEPGNHLVTIDVSSSAHRVPDSEDTKTDDGNDQY